jgi:hypothetical protein
VKQEPVDERQRLGENERRHRHGRGNYHGTLPMRACDERQGFVCLRGSSGTSRLRLRASGEAVARLRLP